MPKRTRRQPSPASHPPSVPELACQRELTTKRRGELAELAFTLKAASLGFGVSRPFGDSERYDAIVDAREILPDPKRRCHRACPVVRSAYRKRTPRLRGVGEIAIPKTSTLLTLPGVPRIGTTDAATLSCPALRVLNPSNARNAWCPPQPTAPLWRVQIKCSTQLGNGMYHLNAHRRTGGRAVPYLPGEIDFLAAYIIPEDTWYILPLEAFLGSTSLLFRRHDDPRPGLYDAYREAWRLLHPRNGAGIL